MDLSFIKPAPTTLRELGRDERWLQERINEDPSILGLGDLTIIERERAQPSGGRIDFVLADPEEGVRYEVEIMLGRLDESHIIRAIEYWDVERTRYPNLEHRAVIVAEEITNRFFNVISLLNRAVPIVAVQLNAYRTADSYFLSFTKVLDIADLFANEEETAGEQVDRSFWEKRTNTASIAVVDSMIGLVPTIGHATRVTYNKHHIALGTTGRNFVWFHPRKNAPHCHMHLNLTGDERATWVTRLAEAGLDAGPRGNQMKLRLTAKELGEHSVLIRGLLGEIELESRS